MLVASLFSCVIGTLIPASIYVNQSIQFRKPVFVDDAVTARVKVRSLTPKRKNTIMLTCQTQVVSKDNGTLLVDGEANILLTEPKE
jgi:3-hydroxybutyryl-CoA dehydratase